MHESGFFQAQCVGSRGFVVGELCEEEDGKDECVVVVVAVVAVLALVLSARCVQKANGALELPWSATLLAMKTANCHPSFCC